MLACLAFGPQAAAQTPPTASDNTVTTTEDTAYSFTAADFNFADADTGDTLASVKIVTLPALGALTNDDTAVTANQEIARADIDSNRLVFTPAADGNGDSYTSFTFKVSDGADESASAYTMTVDVTAANDAPTASDNTVTTTEDTAYTLAAADFNFSDTDTGDMLASVKIVTLPGLGALTNDGTAVRANQSIARADIDANELVFTPVADAHGDSYTSFTFKVSDGADESASAYTITVDVTAVTDAPTASDNTVTTTEDTAYTFTAADFNFSDADTGDTLASVKIVTLPALGLLTNGGTAVRADESIAKADIDANRLVFTPVADGNGDSYTSFTFKVSDGTDESASAYTMTVDVTAANAVPTASDSTVTTTEDTAYTFTAADFNFADADTGDTLASVKIVTLPALGSLTNDDTAVRADQSIARADIDANRLVFTPVADGNGDHYTSFTFKVSDGADESASAYTVTVDVTAVTDAPTASDSTVTATEDTAYAFAAADFNFFDADTGDTLSSVKIVTLPALGSLTNDDTAVRADQSIARADIDANRLVFTPAADGNGDPYTSFTFKVSDGADESASAYTMTVGVTAVNDVPTASDSTVTATQDTAYSFAAADFNFASGDTGDTLSSVKIVTLPALGSLTNDDTAVTANQEIAKADIDANRLVFTPAANVHGDSYTSFTFKVSDGADESASAYTMTVDVTAANDAPTASDNTVTTTEDTAYTLAAADFNFSDTDTGDMLASVKIVTLPGLGALTNDGTAVRANQSIARADIDANKLVFIPVADAHGDSYTSFTFKVSDGADESASAYTMTVDVTAVTDAPTASDSTVTATEDTAYSFAAADFNFASGDTGDALASVKIVTLPALGSLTNGGTAVTANQEIAKADIDANRLVFTPAANVHGDSYTSFTFKVSDGTDESASAYTMTVDVDAANDAPTASNSTVTATEDTAYAFTAADFNFSDTDTDTGDMLASVKIVTLPGLGSLTNGGTAVTANQEIAKVEIDANRLVFTPAADGNGDPYTSFTFKVSDGTDESASANTMTVRVTAVNDAPTAAHGGVTTLEDTDYAFAAADFNFSDVEVDDTLSSVRIVTLPALGSLANDGTAVTANQTIARADIDSGRLVFSPAANADGDRYARFTFKVSDGDRESASTYTMTINVTATVETGMVQGWNARFGRTIGGQLVDAVTARFEFGGGSQVTLGGERIGGFGPGEPEEAAGFADQLGWMKDAENAAGPRATRGMTGKELLRGSAFHLSGGEAEGDGGYVVWGHVAVGAFEARADDMKMDGDVTTRLLGVDGKWGRVLAGFALARSEGEGSFRQVVLQSDRGGRGTIDSSLSGVYPYARLAFGEGLTAWALAGYGAGSLTLTPKDEEAFRTSLAMQIGTLGVKGLILGGEEMGALRISVKSDAMWVHTASDGARGLNEAEGNARRLRLMLDAERSFGAGEDAAITPSGEIGLRHDGGDAETGAGLELGGGFRYVVGGFTAAGRARLLVSHDAAGHKEWGASGSLALSPDALARGLSYSLRPVWGQADSGTGALWSLDDARDLGTGRAFEAEGRLEARLGYGFAAIGDRFTATPELRLRLAESHRRYSAGWRLEHARRERVDFDLLFEATRRGSDDRQPEYGLGVRGSIRW